MEIRPLKTKADWKVFFDLPYLLYKNQPHFVPPLRMSVKDSLNPKRAHLIGARMQAFVAWDGIKPVGRVLGILDREHEATHQDGAAFFGFLDVIDQPKITALLLETVEDWAKKQGAKSLRGPMNPSMHHECGLLIETNDDIPTFMNPFSPPFLKAHLESAGYQKIKDLFCWELETATSRLGDLLQRQAERLQKRAKVSIRSIRSKNMKEHLEHVRSIFNEAWKDNWGFVPLSKKGFDEASKDLLFILQHELCMFVEVNGEVAGFALVVPDVNQALVKIPNGALFPFGIFKLLWHLKVSKTTIDRCRVLLLGVRPQYRPLGLGALIYAECFKRCLKAGFKRGEASWILEDNKAMNRPLALMGAKKTKTYRIYSKDFIHARFGD